jgi:serine/threonine protein kinase
VPEYRTGDVLGDEYEIRGTLGGGSYGLVFKVMRLLDGREYALKLLPTSGIERARRELRALQAVNHPHINRVVWAGRLSSGPWYLLTELVEGENLRALIDDDHPLPLVEVARLGMELLDALDALHPQVERIEYLRSLPELDAASWEELQRLESEGLVHRDIKPENIMVRQSGDLVLIDFGIASLVGDPVRTTSHTPGYRPPDADLTRWDPDTDLFAAGAVMFELICGRLPYTKHRDTPLDSRQIRPDLPDPLADFLGRACAPRREARFGTAIEMYDALSEVAESLKSGTLGADMAAEAQFEGASQDADIDTLFDLLAPYQSWIPRPFPGAGAAALDAIIEGLVDIVTAEGPIVCARLYELYVAASGDPGVRSVKSHLNRAAYYAVQDGRLAQVEPVGGGQIDKTVYLPHHDPVAIRERGPRKLLHIPCSEVRAFARAIEDSVPDTRMPTLHWLEIMYGALDANWWETRHLGSCIGVHVDPPAREGQPTLPFDSHCDRL